MNADQLGEVLSAFLDGELTPDEAQQVEALLQRDESARQLLNELTRTARVVSSLPHRSAPDSILEQVRTRLERNELLEDFPNGLPRRSRLWPWARGILSMAAVLGVVAIAGMWILTEDPPKSQTARESLVSTHRDQERGVPARGTEPGMRSKEGVARRESSRSVRRSTRGRGEYERVALGDERADRTHTISKKSAPRAGVSRVADDEPTAAYRDTSRPTSDTVPSVTYEFAEGRSTGADAVVAQAMPGAEVMRLKVTVSTAAERDALLSRLGTRFVRTPWLGAPSSGADAASELPGRLAVRVPFSQVDSLLASVEAQSGVSDMALAAGPLTVRGKQRVREVLALAFAPDDADAPGAYAGGAAAKPPGPSGPGGYEWRDLLRSLGLNPDTLASLTERSGGDGPRGDDESKVSDARGGTAKPIARKDTPGDRVTMSSRGSSAGRDGPSESDADEGSLVARRLRRLEPVPSSPSDTENGDGSRTADAPSRKESERASLRRAGEAVGATIDVVIEVVVAGETPHSSPKPSYPTRARRHRSQPPASDAKRPIQN